jgi:hypothetical protein
MTTQKEIRAAFWAAHPTLIRRRDGIISNALAQRVTL